MASITKLPSGSYRVLVRRKSRYASETFLRHDIAQRWARRAESRVDQGLAPTKPSTARLTTFGHLIDFHIDDMRAVGKPPLNDQRIPLFAAIGYDAWALVQAQAGTVGGLGGRIFPYNSRSVGPAFRRACRELEIEDLHFHDLRHEGTSRLFEAGFTIEQAALVTGHKDWKMLRRYTHIRPEALHALAARRPIPPTSFLGAE